MRALTSQERWSTLLMTSVCGSVAMVVIAGATAGGASPASGSDGEEETAKVAWHEPASDWEAPTAKPRSGCKLTTLPGPAEYSKEPKWGGEVDGMSASGKYIVGEAGRDEVLWHDGKYQKLDGVPKSNELVDVNSSGIVAGVESGNDVDKPWIYEKGELTYLKLPKLGVDEMVEVVSINDDGYVLGNHAYDNGIDREAVKPLMWKIDEPKKYFAPDLPAGTKAGGAALTNDSTVVGATSRGKVWTWNAAEGDAPKPVTKAGNAPDGEHDAGAAGDWMVYDEQRWRLSDGAHAGLALDASDAIDGDGRVYGTKGALPAIADGREVTELPAIAPRPDDASELTNRVTEVSQDGKVMAGNSSDEHGTAFPVTWTC